MQTYCLNYKSKSNFIQCKINNLKDLVTKRDNPHKVKKINANIWCHATNDVGFTRPENFASDLSMKLLHGYSFRQLGRNLTFSSSYWSHLYRGWSLKFNFSIYDIWLNSATGSFLLENSREMRVNAINFSMSIIILSKKVYFRQISFRYVSFLL